MLKAGKTKVAIISLVILAIIAVSVFAVFVAAATHTSTVDVTPHIVPNVSSVEFDADVKWASGDPIHEFRVYQPLEFSDLACKNDPASEWYNPIYGHTTIGGTEYYYCQWSAKTGHVLDGANPQKNFIFSLNTAKTECCRDLYLETRDDNGAYVRHNPQACVDTSPPNTIKTFDGPQKEEGGVEWIDGVTKVVLTATDPQPHPSGVEETKYINILAEDFVNQHNLNCNPEKPCWEPAYCQGLADFAHNILENDWNIYNEPFQKAGESCHVLFYYSEDKVGNKENIQVNCFFVDKTPPVGTKEVGDPKIPQDIEEIGEGKAGWSVEEVYSPTHSAKLYVLDGSQDWAGVDIAVDIPLKDITELSFRELIESYTPKGWSVNVILGVDADGDGEFEADLPGWHIGTDAWTLKALNGDTFVQMDGKKGNPTTDVWTQTDALLVSQWWTPDESGAGFAKSNTYPSTFYDTFDNLINVFIPDSTQTSLIPDVNARVKLIKLVIGGSGSWMDETAFVDDLSLNGNVIMSESPTYWITQSTPITLRCTDPEPHPSNDVTIYWKWSLDGGDWNEESYKGEEYILKFDDSDSVHDLEFWCVDAVEKESVHDIEIFRVDSQPPIITKEMIGTNHLAKVGTCPPTSPNDKCYVADDGKNGVKITVKDDDVQYPTCAVDQVTCNYELWWETTLQNCIDKFGGTHLYNEQTGECFVEGDEFSDTTSVIFHQDSTHTLKIWCEDALGNSVEDVEEFLVDSTPPTTTKTYGDPHYPANINDPANYPHWITSQTLINLNAIDAKVGVDQTFWRYIVVDNRWCKTETSGCQNYDETINEQFVEYTTDVRLPEESCHLIEYYSVDKLGNEETIKRQCVFVENNPPTSEKVIGEPQEIVNDQVYITQQTPITITCTDLGDHPVDHSSLWYRYRLSDDCINWGVWTEWDDPIDDIKIINFPEDSCHELEYYCVDALGNTEIVQSEIDIVDTQAPEIIKEIIGPQWGECPPENLNSVVNGDNHIEEKCYIDGVTTIKVIAKDLMPHPVNDVKCSWWYYVNDEGPFYYVDAEGKKQQGKSQETASPFEINFPEESKHDLWIQCWDALENGMNDAYWDHEVFYVDLTAPITTHEIIGPWFINENKVEWIDGITEIKLNVEDAGPHETGIKETKYRVTLVNDINCWEKCIAEGDNILGGWQTYSGEPFGDIPESCHLIEYYSVDNVNKTETVNKQCVFVDKTAPEPLKEVGEPKVACQDEECDLWEWKITKETPIKLSCEDIGDHPSGGAEVCWRVWWDKTQAWGDWDCVEEGTEIFLEESCVHELEFYCKDNVEKESIHDNEWIKVEGRPFEIQINKKWNLISVPVVLLNDDPEVIFDSMEECIESVWTWDGAAGEEGEWYVYTLDNIENDNLDEIIPGWGYWVKAKDECTLLIGGDLLAPKRVPPSRNLVPGWNLIGYYGREDVEVYDGPDGEGADAYCALWSLTSGELGLPKWSSLYGYWESEFEGYSMFAQLDPGAGYWINMKDNQETYIYSPSTICYKWYGGYF